MSYFDDDMTGHPAGAGTPNGFTQLPFSNGTFINASGLYGANTYEQIIGGIYTTSVDTGGISLIVAFNSTQNIRPQGQFFQLTNGDTTNPLFGVQNRVLYTLRIEEDGSLTAFSGDGQLIDNSNAPGNDFSLSPEGFYFIQINVAITSQVVLGVSYIKIDTEVGIAGTTILQGSVITNIQVAALFTGSPVINIWSLSAGGYLLNDLTGESIVPMGTWPNPGSPFNRITQEVVEVQVLPAPSDAFIRIGQEVVELQILPTTAFIRISQEVIELMVRGGVPALTGGWKVREL